MTDVTVVTDRAAAFGERGARMRARPHGGALCRFLPRSFALPCLTCFKPALGHRARPLAGLTGYRDRGVASRDGRTCLPLLRGEPEPGAHHGRCAGPGGTSARRPSACGSHRATATAGVRSTQATGPARRQPPGVHAVGYPPNLSRNFGNLRNINHNPPLYSWRRTPGSSSVWCTWCSKLPSIDVRALPRLPSGKTMR